VFRKAGWLPPLPPAVAEEKEAVGLFRIMNAQMRQAVLVATVLAIVQRCGG
jgi:hypothetical protein